MIPQDAVIEVTEEPQVTITATEAADVITVDISALFPLTEAAGPPLEQREPPASGPGNFAPAVDFEIVADEEP